MKDFIHKKKGENLSGIDYHFSSRFWEEGFHLVIERRLG